MRNLSRTAYPFLLRALSGEGLKESKQEVNLGSVSLSWFKPLSAGNISLSKKTNRSGSGGFSKDCPIPTSWQHSSLFHSKSPLAPTASGDMLYVSVHESG